MPAHVIPIEFETERLRLRRWLERDRAPFAAMNADPEVMRYFPAPWTAAMSNDAIDRWLADFDARGWSNWAVELASTREFIGFIGLSIPRRALPCTPYVEIGWRLAQAHWKHGYATEGARAALEIGFERLVFDEIVSFTSLLNAPSRRVMERIGLRDAHADFDHPGVPEGHELRRHCLYRLSREEWSGCESRRSRCDPLPDPR